MPDWFPKQTIGDLLNQAAERYGPREALMYEGRRWTFDEFRAEVDRVARALINLGVQTGDKVSIWMPNRAEWLFLFGAVAKIGAVLVPINTRFRTGDMEYLVNHSDSTALILMDRSGPVDFLDMLREVAPEIDTGDANELRPSAFPALRNVVVLGENHPLAPSIGMPCWLAPTRCPPPSWPTANPPSARTTRSCSCTRPEPPGSPRA